MSKRRKYPVSAQDLGDVIIIEAEMTLPPEPAKTKIKTDKVKDGARVELYRPKEEVDFWNGCRSWALLDPVYDVVDGRNELSDEFTVRQETVTTTRGPKKQAMRTYITTTKSMKAEKGRGVHLTNLIRTARSSTRLLAFKFRKKK